MIVVLVLAWPAGYALARLAFAHLVPGLMAGASLPPHDVHRYSMWAGFGLLMFFATELIRRKTSTESFRIGAEGEERVGAVLDSLWRYGCVAIHDVPLQGWGNIDHIVVGPGGVYTVETKNTAGTVTIRGGRVRQAGHDRSAHIDQARRQAEIVRRMLAADPLLSSVQVTPIVCYAKASVEAGIFTSNVVRGVRILTPRGLLRLKKAPERLTAVQVRSACDIFAAGARPPASRALHVSGSAFPGPRAASGQSFGVNDLVSRLLRWAVFGALQVAVGVLGIILVVKIVDAAGQSVIDTFKPTSTASSGTTTDPRSTVPSCDLNALKAPCVYRPSPGR